MLFAATVTVDGLGMGVLFKLIVHVHYHYLTSPLIFAECFTERSGVDFKMYNMHTSFFAIMCQKCIEFVKSVPK